MLCENIIFVGDFVTIVEVKRLLKILLTILTIMIIVLIVLVLDVFKNDEDTINNEENEIIDQEVIQEVVVNENDNDIVIHSVDGYEYTFNYHGEDFYVYKDYENWRIIDSYKIDNTNDMKDIITALINIYPIPSKDYNSYRSVEDMLQEWEIHNFAYNMLPDDSEYKNRVKDVDFNPADEGKTLEDYFKEYTGIDYSQIYDGSNG